MAGQGVDRSGDAAEVDTVPTGGGKSSSWDKGPRDNFDMPGLPGSSGRRGMSLFGGRGVGSGGGDVQSFIGSLTGSGITRKSRYKVKIKGPAGSGPRSLSLRCESISMPGQNIRSTPDPLRFGPEREHAQGVTYGPITATFITDRLQSEKAFFERWQNLVVNMNTWEPNYYDSYVGGVEIFNLDERNNTTYGVELFEAFPRQINAQDVGHANGSAYQTFSVEFTYHHWFPTMHGASAGGSFGGMPSGINFSIMAGLKMRGLGIEAMLNLSGGKPGINASLGIESLISQAQATAGVQAAEGAVARPTINTAVVQKRNQAARQGNDDIITRSMTPGIADNL